MLVEQKEINLEILLKETNDFADLVDQKLLDKFYKICNMAYELGKKGITK